ncbi:MAG: hypothetical protein ACXVAY_03770 [Mucilaginibacter sp.]
MKPFVRKSVMFFLFLIIAGVIYPLIISALCKLNVQSSITVGAIFGIIGGVLWVVTLGIGQKKEVGY